MMADTYYLGLDVGTSGLKALIVGADGAVAGQGASSYALHTPCPGCAESDPAEWWSALCLATRQALSAGQIDPARIAGIGFSGQMHTLVLLDKSERPVRPAISWADTRGSEERTDIETSVGRERLIEITGSPAVTAFTATKLLWVRRHEPETWSRARTALWPKDYLRLRLTGARATDPTDAGASGLLDLRTRDWSPVVTGALDLPATLLPEIHASAAIAGTVTPEAADDTGLRAGTPVATGAGDQECAALGCGVVDPGSLLITLGTGGQVFAVTITPLTDPRGRVHALPHALPGRWHLLAAIPAAGLALTWLRGLLPAAVGRPSAAPPIFLPAVAGERTPWMDETARGALVGLDLTHRVADLVYAAREGVAFALRACVDVLDELGVAYHPVLVTGGLSGDGALLQTLANVLGRPLAPAVQREGSAYGAAILGARATDTLLAPGRPAPIDVLMQPETAEVSRHAGRYEIYRRLYPALQAGRAQ